MKIIISNSCPVPIYEQIKDQIISQIMADELHEGEPIPSIRALANDIKISVMTIKKAYDELESEGFIKSIQGKGTFVAPKNTQLAREKANKEIEDHMFKIIDIANRFNISKEEIYDLFEFIYRSDEQ
ncbi:MAG: GntR family transcriptional regulator [Erysipelotrichia bacterium]|nr:GntR family transcriptional regulator [Erysipelotrichia bacterium]